MKHPILEKRKYLLLYFIFWMAMALIQTLVLNINFKTGLWLSFADSAIMHFSFAIYALSVWYALVYATDNKKGFFYLVFNQITIAVMILMLWFFTYWFVSGFVLPKSSGLNVAGLAWRATLGIMYYVLVLTFYFAFRYYMNWQEKLLLEVQLREKNREAELAVIKSQINPHFLFNSLNSLSYLILSNTDLAHEMLIKLSDFLRYSISQPSGLMAQLQQEIENSKRYLSIETTRFGARLSYEFQIEDDCLQMQLPALLLQPLFENAIKHNLHDSTETITIKTQAFAKDGILFISIGNNRPSHKMYAQKGTGLGIKSVQDRLFLVYGDKARMHIVNQPAEFVVKLEIPQNKTI